MSIQDAGSDRAQHRPLRALWSLQYPHVSTPQSPFYKQDHGGPERFNQHPEAAQQVWCVRGVGGTLLSFPPLCSALSSEKSIPPLAVRQSS